MRQISDKALVVLLIFVIILVLSSTIIAVARFPGLVSITGEVTKGVVNVTIETLVALNVSIENGSDPIIHFGNGTVNPAFTQCNLSTTGIKTGCDGFATVTEGFKVTNVGNVNLSFNISSITAAQFLGGTIPIFRFNVTKNETNNFLNITNESSWWDFDGLYQRVANTSGTKDLFCHLSDLDELNVDILIGISETSFKGLRNATVNFTAYQF